MNKKALACLSISLIFTLSACGAASELKSEIEKDTQKKSTTAETKTSANPEPERTVDPRVQEYYEKEMDGKGPIPPALEGQVYEILSKRGDLLEGAELEAKQKTEKYNAYVSMSSSIDSRFIDYVMQRYAKEFGLEKGKYKPNKKRFYYTGGSFDGHYLETLTKGFEFATKEPSLPIDSIVLEMQPSLEKLVAAMGESYEYYEYKEYVDDDYKKGAEFHDRISEAYEEFKPIYKKFIEEFNTLMRARDDELLQDFQDAGKNSQAAVLDFMIKSRAVGEEFQRQKIDASNVLELDMEAFTPFYDSMLESFQTLRACKETETNETMIRFLDDMIDKAGEVKAAASAVIQRITDKKAFSKRDLSLSGYISRSSGSPENYLAKFNDFIEEYNRNIRYAN